MKTVAIIQARVSSTRLPGKVLLPLEGKTVLERVIERVASAKKVNKVVVATSLDKSDDAIQKLCKEIGIDCFRGSLDDVLERFYLTAKEFKADHIVRITADCPLMDAGVVDLVVSTHLLKGSEYTANILKETFPDGEDVEVVKFCALEKAWREAKLLSDREHVTTYIRNHSGLFSLSSVENGTDLSGNRWTLDNPEDYEFIKAVYGYFYEKGQSDFGMSEILSFLGSNRRIAGLNAHIKRNEGYVKSLKEDKNDMGITVNKNAIYDGFVGYVFNKILALANYMLMGYERLLSPFKKYIYSNDSAFNVYVIPFRIFHSFRRTIRQQYPFSYLIDLATKRTLKYREGKCETCGSCCEGCPDLIQDGDKWICKTYKRRTWCDVYFPINKDQLIRTNLLSKCGYSFKEEKNGEITGSL